MGVPLFTRCMSFFLILPLAVRSHGILCFLRLQGVKSVLALSVQRKKESPWRVVRMFVKSSSSDGLRNPKFCILSSVVSPPHVVDGSTHCVRYQLIMVKHYLRILKHVKISIADHATHRQHRRDFFR